MPKTNMPKTNMTKSIIASIMTCPKHIGGRFVRVDRTAVPRGARGGAMLLAWASLVLLAARAATESVEFNAALTNGTHWTYSDKVALFSEAPGNAYFKSAGAEIVSPEFARPLVALTLDADYTATQRARPVAIAAWAAGASEPDPALARVVAAGDGSVTLRHAWNAADRVVRIALTSGTGAGNFALRSAALTWADEAILPPPEALVERELRGDRFVARWTNAGEPVSNRVEVWQTRQVPFAGEVVGELGLAAFVNDNLKNARDALAQLLQAFPGCGGEKLYVPAQSAGVIQIGNGEAPGEWRLPPRSDYAGLSLLVRAACHPGDCRQLAVRCRLGEALSEVGTFAIGETPADLLVPLGDLPGEASVVLASARRTEARVRVEGVSFVRHAVAAHVETNGVFAAVFPAASRCAVSSLTCSSAGFWRVASISREGQVAPSECRSFVTGDRPGPYGLQFTLR